MIVHSSGPYFLAGVDWGRLLNSYHHCTGWLIAESHFSGPVKWSPNKKWGGFLSFFWHQCSYGTSRVWYEIFPVYSYCFIVGKVIQFISWLMKSSPMAGSSSYVSPQHSSLDRKRHPNLSWFEQHQYRHQLMVSMLMVFSPTGISAAPQTGHNVGPHGFDKKDRYLDFVHTTRTKSACMM